jgi:hypothetical protein
VKWLEPWYSISSDLVQAAGLEGELYRELSAGHPLFGLPARAIGRRDDCDDVLYCLEDGRAALVHLTWISEPPDRPPWPHTTFFPSLATWAMEGMRADHDDFNA